MKISQKDQRKIDETADITRRLLALLRVVSPTAKPDCIAINHRKLSTFLYCFWCNAMSPDDGDTWFGTETLAYKTMTPAMAEHGAQLGTCPMCNQWLIKRDKKKKAAYSERPKHLNPCHKVQTKPKL